MLGPIAPFFGRDRFLNALAAGGVSAVAAAESPGPLAAKAWVPQAMIPDSKTTRFARRSLSCIALPVSEKMGSAPVDASKTVYSSVGLHAQAGTFLLARCQLSRNAAGDHLRHGNVVVRMRASPTK